MLLVSRTDVGYQSGRTRGREVTRIYKWREKRDISSEERETKVARREIYRETVLHLTSQ